MDFEISIFFGKIYQLDNINKITTLLFEQDAVYKEIS